MRLAAFAALLLAVPSLALAQPKDRADVPSVTARGTAEVRVAPDRAVVRLGVQRQGSTAGEAQELVNTVMQDVMSAMRRLNIAPNRITTQRVTLYPVYAQRKPDEAQEGPTVVGFRAANTVSVELDLGGKGPSVGAVIDAAVTNGANSVEGVSFDLAKEGPHRLEALRQAAKAARAKAAAIAAALGYDLGALLDSSEGGVEVGPPRPMAMKFDMARSVGTSVSPGEVTVQAMVRVRYALTK